MEKESGGAAILQQLDMLVKLTATGLVQGKSKKDAIYLLGNLELPRPLIAQIVETTPLTVSVTLSEKRKQKKKLIKGAEHV